MFTTYLSGTADEGGSADKTVIPALACPHCDENRIDWLIWQDDEIVVCQSCQTDEYITPEA